MEREVSDLDSLPEVPAYPVAPPAVSMSSSMVDRWDRPEQLLEEPISPNRPVLGPAGALAASIHGRIPRGYPSASASALSAPPPPPRRPETVLKTQDGLDLVAEVRRAKARIGTRVQTYG